MTAPTVTRVCAPCGATFTVLERTTRKPGRGQYCSKSCSSRARAGITFPALRTRETRVCRCGASFEVRPSRIKAGKGTFCSRPCKEAAARKPQPVKAKPKPAPKPVTVKPVAHKFGAAARPANVGRHANTVPPLPASPRVDDLPITECSGLVRCARCSGMRERGVRCSCERWTPDGQPVEGAA